MLSEPVLWEGRGVLSLTCCVTLCRGHQTNEKTIVCYFQPQSIYLFLFILYWGMHGHEISMSSSSILVRCLDCCSCYHPTCLLTYTGLWHWRVGGGLGGWIPRYCPHHGLHRLRSLTSQHYCAGLVTTNTTKTLSHVRHCWQGFRNYIKIKIIIKN